MKKTYSFIILLISSFLTMKGQVEWEVIPFDFNSHVWDFEVFEGDLVIGGNFTRVNNLSSRGSVIYNGSTITRNTNESQGGGGFESLTTHQGKLFGGGSATIGSFSISSAMVLEWQGSKWGGSSYELNGNVQQVVSFNDTLFTISTFTSDELGNDFPFDYVGYHNGSKWQTAGLKSLNARPRLFVFDEQLYAYGGFTKYGDEDVKYFAKWQKENWVQVDSSRTFGFPVEFKGELYAFDQIENNFFDKTYQLIKWNGTVWEEIVGQTVVSGGNSLRAVTSDENGIYIAGDLEFTGGVETNNAAKFDGTGWVSIGTALDSVLVNTLEFYDGHLYAGTLIEGGAFGTAYVYRVDVEQILNSVHKSSDKNDFFYYDHYNGNINVLKEGLISIIGTNGELVFDKKQVKENDLLSLDKLNKGVYISLFESDGVYYTEKVIKH